MEVWLFGNPDVPEDALPLRLLPRLRIRFPQTQFVVKDPNEEWEIPEHLTVIDTVVGIDRVQQFNDLESFAQSPRVSLHDFDALANLRLLQKLGKLKNVTIIGVPPKFNKHETLEAVAEILSRLTKEQLD